VARYMDLFKRKELKIGPGVNTGKSVGPDKIFLWALTEQDVDKAGARKCPTKRI